MPPNVEHLLVVLVIRAGLNRSHLAEQPNLLIGEAKAPIELHLLLLFSLALAHCIDHSSDARPAIRDAEDLREFQVLGVRGFGFEDEAL